MSKPNPTAGVCSGVPVGGGSYFDAGQFADGPASLVAQGERIRIDEEVDVVIDHPVVELPGVLLNIGAGFLPVCESIFDAGVQQPFYFTAKLFRQCPSGDDGSQRKRQSGAGFPQLSQVGDQLQAQFPIDETAFVDQHPGVDSPRATAGAISEKSTGSFCVIDG